MKCECCKQEFNLPCREKEYKWKLDHQLFCSYKCYSKVFDSKYQEARFNKKINVGWKRNR